MTLDWRLDSSLGGGRGVERSGRGKGGVPSVMCLRGTEGVGKGFFYPTSCLCCPFSSVLGEPRRGLCWGPRCSWGKILGCLLWNSDPGQGCLTK